jgi:hypothetical protein
LNPAIGTAELFNDALEAGTSLRFTGAVKTGTTLIEAASFPVAVRQAGKVVCITFFIIPNAKHTPHKEARELTETIVCHLIFELSKYLFDTSYSGW